MLDGTEAIAASAAEIDRVEVVADGQLGRVIGVVLYGATASPSPLVDPGGVRRMLARGRAWGGLGQVEVGGAGDRAEIADMLWQTIGRAWNRRVDNDIVTALATGRGWQSLRYRVGPISGKEQEQEGKNYFSHAFI